MSLLNSGPHSVIVTPKVTVRGSLGSEQVDGEPVTVPRVAVQPTMIEEDLTSEGTSAASTYRLIGRGAWPGGPLSKVEVVSGPHLGTYDQDGPARVYGMSPRTAHYDVLLRRRGEADR